MPQGKHNHGYTFIIIMLFTLRGCMITLLLCDMVKISPQQEVDQWMGVLAKLQLFKRAQYIKKINIKHV